MVAAQLPQREQLTKAVGSTSGLIAEFIVIKGIRGQQLLGWTANVRYRHDFLVHKKKWRDTVDHVAS